MVQPSFVPNNNAILNQAVYVNFVMKRHYWEPKLAGRHKLGTKFGLLS
jgi:hypothetical protein